MGFDFIQETYEKFVYSLLEKKIPRITKSSNFVGLHMLLSISL